MKTRMILIAVTFILQGCLFIMTARCDPPNDAPPPPSGHGSSSNSAPAGAPIDGGLAILAALGIAYGGLKQMHSRKCR